MLRGIRWRSMLSVCIILMFFYGCSNGGGGSGSSSSASSTSSSLLAYSYYKFYIDNNSSSLYAVDPNNPTSPIYVDNVDKDNMLYYKPIPIIDSIFSYKYDASTYTVLNAHKSYIIYSKNGLIYKLPTAINADLIPTQVSNLNTTICNLQVETENSNSNLDFISVDTAGPDGVCYGWCATTSTYYSTDNQHYLVRLDMSSTDAPISVPQKYYIDDYYYNYNTGNIEGIFIDNNGTYEACDENLANCITLNATDLEVIGDYPSKVYLCINGTGIYSFDKTSKALTLIEQLSYWLGDSIPDGNNIYFSSSSTIYKLDTISNSVTSLYSDTLPIKTIDFTNNKITYSTYNSTSDFVYIKILDKTTPTYPITIYSFNSTSYLSFYSNYGGITYDVIITTGNKIIIPTNNATVIYDENGNLLQTFNGTMIGIQYSNSGSKLSGEWTPIKMLIENNVTLNAISLNDLSVTTIAELLPTDIEWKNRTGLSFSYNNVFLLTGITNNYSGDIFFFDTSKANSLTRLTNTSDDEMTLSWWWVWEH